MKKVSFQDSKLSKIRFLINGSIALLIYLIIPKNKRKKESWLIGGHLGRIYDDNSKAFFEYVISNNLKKDIYWVLNKGSLAEKTNPHNNNIIYRGTIKNYLHCYRSKVVFVSHSFADVLPIFYKIKDIVKIKSIYLFHGVYGLKKVEKSSENIYNRYFDVLNSVGEVEKNIKVEQLSINEEKIKIMGLPRFDNLIMDKKSNKDILVMFTWR